MLDEFTLAKKNVISYVNACRELAASNGDKTICNTLSTLCTELENFTLNVAVVGDIKRGKSTLINTLLGRSDDALSPVGATICTSAIVKYRNYKPGMEHEPHGMVYYDNSSEIGYRVNYEDLKALISQEFNKDNEKGVRCIEVFGDFPLLGNCCLVDTPGVNATIDRHGEMVSEFLPSADAVILPIMANQPMTNSEQEMLRALPDKRRIFYVLTKVDFLPQTELPTVTNWVQNCIREAGLTIPHTIYKVSCKKVFDAQKSGMDERTLKTLRHECGIAQLERELSSFMLNQSDEGRLLAQRLISAVTMARDYLTQRRKANEALIETQGLTADEVEAECKRIQAEFDEFQKDMRRRLTKFASRWDREVERGLEGLELSVDAIEADVSELIDKSSFLKLFHLGSAISAKVRPHVLKTTERLESRITPLIDALNQDLEEGVALYSKRVQAGSLSGVSSALVAIGASATTIATVSLPALSAVITAVNGYIAAAGSATAASSGILPTIIGWLGLDTMVGWLGVTTAEVTLATAGTALMSALMSTIIPVLLGILALKLTGPLAGMFVKWRIPGLLEKSIKEVRGNLQKQLDKWKNTIISRCEDVLNEQREEMEEQLEKQRQRLLTLDPAAKRQAEMENKTIAGLLGQDEHVSRCVRALPCGK